MGEPLLAPALRLLEEGKDGEALALLQSPQEDLPEAERLALLGFVEARKGNLRAYRALALKAARRAQTPLTLYHLGLALPPRAGVLALEEALRRFRGDAKGEARLHLALAVALERLGRPEALGHAALARLEDPSPWTILHHLRLELFFGTKPLPRSWRTRSPSCPTPSPGCASSRGTPWPWPTSSGEARGGQGTSSGASSPSWSRQASRASWPSGPWPWTPPRSGSS